jgi:hypothetical protein
VQQNTIACHIITETSNIYQKQIRIIGYGRPDLQHVGYVSRRCGDQDDVDSLAHRVKLGQQQLRFSKTPAQEHLDPTAKESKETEGDSRSIGYFGNGIQQEPNSYRYR